MEKCKICSAEMNNFIDMNNGAPLVEGNVCNGCNYSLVIPSRMMPTEQMESMREAIKQSNLEMEETAEKESQE